MGQDITFDIIARDRASTSFSRIGKSVDATGNKFRTLGKLGRVAALGIAAGAAAAAAGSVVLLKSSVSKASDLSETVNKSNVIFGKNASAMLKWSTGSAKAFGLSQQAALDSAAGFGDMFKQIGFAGKQSAKMSRQVVQMSADFGSFNNLPTAEVTEMISAALRGEFDSLQRVIPNINAARVETEALAKTGKKSAKELTAQEKAAATLAIIHKDGSRAAGDFKRTSGGLANQQKILAAQFDNVQAKIGKALIPAATKLVGFLSKSAIPRFRDFAGIIRTDVVPVVRSVADWVKNSLIPAFQRFGSEQSKTGGLIQKFGAWVRSTFADVKSIMVSTGQIISVFWAKYGDLITKYGISTLKNLLTVTRGVFTVIAGLFKTVAAVMKGDWSGAWDGIKQTVRGAVGIIRGLVGQMLNQVKTMFAAGARAMVSAGRALIGGLWSGIKGAWGAVARFFGNVGSKIKTAIGNMATLLYNAGKAVIGGLAKGIWDATVGKLGGTLSDVTGFIKSHKGPIEKDRVLLKPAGAAIIDGLIAGINGRKGALKTVLGRLTTLISKTADKVSNLKEIRSGFASTFSADSIFGADMETSGSLQGLLKFQSDQASKAAQLLSDVSSVTSKGLSKSLIAQLQSAGSAGASQLHLLAGASSDQIAQFNALDKATTSSLTAAGISLGNAGRGGDINKQITAAEVELATERGMLKALNRAHLSVDTKGDKLLIVLRAAAHAQGKSVIQALS